jgi:mannitol-1-phosphate/altronate dehydrogenase
MKKKILIFGAGAIGRGFVAPLFFKNNYEISFVDSNMSLINKLKKKNIMQD